MKYKVQLFVGGQTFWFTCFATSTFEAEKVALTQYPNARVIFSTATFQIWLVQIEIFGWVNHLVDPDGATTTSTK